MKAGSLSGNFFVENNNDLYMNLSGNIYFKRGRWA